MATLKRGNKTFREEFYESSKLLSDSLGSIRYGLKLAVIKYNIYRPHWGLKGLTPMKYIQSSLKEVA
jgi:transposase InsO family protein